MDVKAGSSAACLLRCLAVLEKGRRPDRDDEATGHRRVGGGAAAEALEEEHRWSWRAVRWTVDGRKMQLRLFIVRLWLLRRVESERGGESDCYVAGGLN